MCQNNSEFYSCPTSTPEYLYPLQAADIHEFYNCIICSIITERCIILK